MQPELKLSAVNGGSYEASGNKATWIPRPGSSKVIDLYFRGKRFELTQEGRGPQGRPRFLVNRTRQPDGKLLQGREIAELIQKLDLFWPDLIEIPVRLDRIEGTLDRIEKAVAGKRQRPPSVGKLCMSPVCITWPQERYIPRWALGGFARVPLPAIPASQQMAAGEYRLLQAILFCAQGTGLLQVGKNILAKIASVREEHVKHYRRSLTNRGVIRPTGRILEYGVREYELLTHPWLVGDNLLARGGQESVAGGTMEAQRGTTVVPLKISNKTCTNKTSEEREKPTLDEVLNFASQNGIDKTIAKIFWNECESRLWMDGKTQRQIAKWRPCLTAYWQKWQKNLPPGSVLPSYKSLPKPDPSKIDLPADFKPWLASAWPEHREEAELWKTWADVPNEVTNHWYGGRKPPFAAREISQ